MARSGMKPYTFDCAYCGKTQTKHNYNSITLPKYCNSQCMGKARKGKPLGGIRGTLTEITCRQCGKKVIFGTYKVKVKKRSFCSRDCWRTWNGLEASHRTATRYTIPKKQRHQMLRQREQKCELCGYSAVPEILELHHLDRNTRNGSHDNLKLLCPNCHQIEHFKTHTGRFNKKPRNQKKKPLESPITTKDTLPPWVELIQIDPRVDDAQSKPIRFSI